MGKVATVNMRWMPSHHTSKTDGGAADWLALRHAPGLTPKAAGALLAEFGDARTVREACACGDAPLRLGAETLAFLRAPASADYDADLRWAEEPLNHVVPKTSPDYPARFEHLPRAPMLLFVRGDVRLLNDPQIAVVGARKPTPAGEETAAEFSAAFARKGLAITSGLAKGVDACAHRAALRLKAPTLAVVATGLNKCYPPAHAELARQIAEGGALVSEFPANVTPRPEYFPQRNRIISGLSLGVVVVEAGEKSGALITARLAGEYGREVFAIPGSIRNPMTQGCHKLIQQGAKLVQSPEDVFVDLASQLRSEALEPAPDDAPQAATGEALDPAYRVLLDGMGYDPVGIDALVERCSLPVAEVASMLLVLEMRGLVSSNNGFYMRIG